MLIAPQCNHTTVIHYKKIVFLYSFFFFFNPLKVCHTKIDRIWSMGVCPLNSVVCRRMATKLPRKLRFRGIPNAFLYPKLKHTCQPSRSRRDSPGLETETRRPARPPKKADSSRFVPINAPKHDFKPNFCLFSLFFSRNSSFFCVFWPFGLLAFPHVPVRGKQLSKQKICIY